MKQTTILEKLKIVFEISKSSKLFILVILALIILAVIGITTTKKTKKRNRKIYAAIYIFIIITLLIMYHSSLSKMFDYMMNNLFIVIYFPNIAVYLAAIIITNIVLWTSIFNLRTSKIVKNINIVIYSIIHYLLALILSIITTNKLDIFSQTSLYGNKEVQALIELSSIIFITWIVFLIIYKIIRKYQLRNTVPVRKKIIIKKVKVLPDNISEVKAPNFVKVDIKQKEAQKELTDEPILIGPYIDVNLKEKEELQHNLEQVKAQLSLAQEQIKLHEEIEEKQQKQIKYEQTEKNKFKQVVATKTEELEKLRNNQKASTDSTTAIMNSLDGMLTLEDYKVLATLLKDKQKRKKEQQELNHNYDKFSQIRQTYKSVK